MERLHLIKLALPGQGMIRQDAHRFKGLRVRQPERLLLGLEYAAAEHLRFVKLVLLVDDDVHQVVNCQERVRVLRPERLILARE